MSIRSRKNSIVEHVRSFIQGSSSHPADQTLIELGSLDSTDVLGYSLHKEAVDGSRKTLKKVLLSAVCVDFPNDRGQTPLFCACSRDREANALLLLQYGANPNEKSQEGVTPTHVSCCVGNVRLLGKLIEAGGDLRLHDNAGNSMRDWALQNPDPKRRTRMLEFLDKTHVCAMAYSGDAVSADHYTKFSRRAQKQTSLMEIMKMRTGSDSNFENLKRVQSMGFGKVYLGGDFTGGIVSVVPLVSEALLEQTQNFCFDAGFGTFIEQMGWLHMDVSVKKVKPDVEPEEGIDNIIAEAEYLGKLRHPNITLLLGICQSTSLENMWLVFENFEDTTLHHFLHVKKHHLANERKRKIIWQVCGAMEFIHSQNLIHCGLSSLAVYLVSSDTAKVGNFEFMVESIKADLGKPSRVPGVLHGRFLYNWMAPELMKEEAPHFSSDVYSFCCILWEMYAGEVPWAGLEYEDIFQKVVMEESPLNLNYAQLPVKLKAIVGYGLELHEDSRLHKFSLISNWLKSELVPKFKRTHSPVRWVNKSSNHPELSSSSSQSSSVPSCSSARFDGTQELLYHNRWDTSKRFSLDFESPVNTALPFSPAIDLSHMSSAREVCSVSVASSDAEMAPRKPPRTFAAGHVHSLPPACFNKNALHKQGPVDKDASEDDRDRRVSPRSPSRIKPASHSYQSGTFTPADNMPDFQFSAPQTRTESTYKCSARANCGTSKQFLINNYESGEDEEKFTVKSMADKYQQIQDQHKLRQAILKGSMAPRGSCVNLKASSESIKFDGNDTDSGSAAVNMSRNRQISEIGSLSGTPLLKGSSTPKCVTKCGIRSAGEVTDKQKILEHEEASESMPAPFADMQDTQGDSPATPPPHHKQDHLTPNRQHSTSLIEDKSNISEKDNDDEESSISKRRAFIEDMKQKYCSIKEKSVTCLERAVSSGGISYHSPVLHFHSPSINKSHSTLAPNNEEIPSPVTDKEISARTSSKCLEKIGSRPTEIQTETDKISTSLRSKYGDTVSTQDTRDSTDLTCVPETPQHVKDTPTKQGVTAAEEDSFWVVTPLVAKREQCANRLSMSSTTTEQEDCDGVDRITSPEQCAGDKMPDDLIPADTTLCENPHSKDGSCNVLHADYPHNGFRVIVKAEGMNMSKTVYREKSVASASLSRQNTHTIDKSGKNDRMENGVHSSEPNAEDKNSVDLNGTFTLDDKDEEDGNQTFTLDLTSPEPLFLPNASFTSEKVVEWVDNQFDRIKDTLSQNSGECTDSNNSLCGIEDIPAAAHTMEVCHSMPQTYSKPQTERKCQQQLRRGDVKRECNISKVDNNDFEYSEYYIDDDLNRIPFSQRQLKMKCKDGSTEQYLHAATGIPRRARSQSHTIDGKPPMNRQLSGKYNAENICQSARCNSNELEDVQHKILSRQSASDKDIASLKRSSIHLIAKTQGSSRVREGVPAKPGAKQPAVFDLLRSGASDPSISTSVARDSRADCKDDEDENTLALTQNLSEDEATTSLAARTKEEGIQAKLEPGDVMLQRPVYDSDSVDSDMWVNRKLKDIQSKIKRRKERNSYVASSEDEDDFSLDIPPPITQSFSYAPIPASSSKYDKPTRSVSCRDLGIRTDNTYSKVMEELKAACRDRQRMIMSRGARRKSTSEMDNASSFSRKITSNFDNAESDDNKSVLKLPENIANKSINKEKSSTVSKVREIKSGSSQSKHRHEGVSQIKARLEGQTQTSRHHKHTGSLPAKMTHSRSSVSYQSSAHRFGFKSLEKGRDCVDSPEWEGRKSVKREGSRRSILRKPSKESILSNKSIPQPMPRSKLKVSPSQVSRSTERAISFEDVSHLDESDQSYQSKVKSTPYPSASKRTKFFSSHGGFKQKSSESEHSKDERDYRRTSRSSLHQMDKHSVVSGGKSSTLGTGSRHSIVSFAKCDDIVEASSSGRQSIKSSSSRRQSPRHKHDVPYSSPSSTSSATTGVNNKTERKHEKLGMEKKKTYDVREHREWKSNCEVNGKSAQENTTTETDGHYLTIGLEQSQDTGKEKGKSRHRGQKGKSAFGMHRFYIPRESWPEGCRAKLDVKVGEDSQRVTTTATNPASGHTETLLDQVFTAPGIKSTIHLE